MGRPPLDKKQRQLAIALRPEIRNWVEGAASAAGHSLAEEIRQRLERTFAEDGVDKPTRELVEAVKWIAEEVNRQSEVESWSVVPRAHEALAAALQTWMNLITPPSRGAVSDDLFGPGDPPTLGRSIARHYQRFKSEMEKTDRELRELHKGKGDRS
jgi:hypothetical protein